MFKNELKFLFVSNLSYLWVQQRNFMWLELVLQPEVLKLLNLFFKSALR